MTAIYSVLHMLVDGVCALSMFGYFASDEKWYLYVLLYNFCAFALQMPLGVVLDAWSERKGKCRNCVCPHFLFALLGVLLTLVGAVTHPIVLGLGNALFHLGGGVGTIAEDNAKGWRGRGLGVFVAPGAIGLFLGTQLAKNDGVIVGVLCAGTGMLLLCVWGWFVSKKLTKDTIGEKNITIKTPSMLLILGCFFVVVLRSYLGMTITFPWKTTLLSGVLAVLATALGKCAGGFLAAGFGWRKATAVSLGLAAICYLFSTHMPVGMFAVFCFNMTMPITLYLLVQELKKMPGFAFGILTFGLFLGFLPEYCGMDMLMDGRFLGCVGSFVSLLILLVCVRRKRGKVS